MPFYTFCLDPPSEVRSCLLNPSDRVAFVPYSESKQMKNSVINTFLYSFVDIVDI